MYIKPKSTASIQKANLKKNRNASTDTLQHLAFDNSSQANIIFTVDSGKIITANVAAYRLLGYSKNELLGKSGKDIFVANKTDLKKLLKQRMAEGQSASVTIITKNSSIIPCEITSAVFIEGGVERSIITLVDKRRSIVKQKNIDTVKERIVANNITLAQTKSDVRLAENNEWIKYIAKTSYDVMWDWDIASGEIYVGDSIAEVFGYKVQNNKVHLKDVSQCIPSQQKHMVEKKLWKILATDKRSWKDSFTFKRMDGSIAFTTCRASIIRDEDGKAIRMIGAIQDVSKLQELENKLEEHKDISQEYNLALQVVWDWNILTNEVFIGEGFEELLGYTKIKNGNIKDWRDYLHPDDKEAVEKALHYALESSANKWKHVYRLKKFDGSSAKVLNRASIFRRENERAFRMVGVMQDTSSLKKNEAPVTEVIEDKKAKLVGKIKSVVLELIHYSLEKLPMNFSDHLTAKLQYDYTYLANIFSEVEGIPIQQYIIAQKIERAKELIEAGELSLTKIASKLQYSSVAHLSTQFKKVTGLTPTEFKLKNSSAIRH